MRFTYQELNRVHSHSETDLFTKDRYRQFHRFFPRHVESILDLGCNTGRGGRALKEVDRGLHIWGLDCLQDRLERVPPGVYEGTFCSGADDIPVKDGSFDVVVAGEFIEHLYSIDVDRALAETFRVLKIGGRLLLTTPNPRYLRRRLSRYTVLGGAHVSQHYHEVVRLRLKMAGYSRIRIYGSGKVTRYLGYRVPILSLYGSYLVIGDKW
ncbi:MAG TPA: class I SAM-dependent methyltransferase [Thermoanaerobaculia bacterium]|nr:class I SAM-dependent methyltransferase [Thermoanaerobaculia bacterium]